MTCPNCGSPCQQGAGGSWACPLCGPVSGNTPAENTRTTGNATNAGNPQNAPYAAGPRIGCPT